MPAVQLRDLFFDFGGHPSTSAAVLRGIDLVVATGEYLVILGESGSGKSTLLRLIAGLEKPTSGQVLIHDKDMASVPPRRRNVSMVFQDDALYPHLTAEQQIRFPSSRPDSKTEEIFANAVQQTRVGPLLGQPTPTLSGGERKRVALAKSIFRRSSIRLLDEPLAAIDASHRQSLRDDLLQVHQNSGGATLHVTHDCAEAMQLADRIAILQDGKIIQVGTPEQLYRHPVHRVVFRLMNSVHLNEIEVDANTAICFSAAAVRLHDSVDSAQDVGLEKVRKHNRKNGEGCCWLPAQVVGRRFFPGGDWLTIRSGDHVLKARAEADGVEETDVRFISIATSDMHWFDAQGAARAAESLLGHFSNS